MTTSRRIALVLAPAVAGIAIVAVVLAPPRGGGAIDLDTEPPTVFVTDPFAIGTTFTLGNTFIPPELERPITITAVEVEHRAGLDLVGTVAFEPRDEAVGALPGWPPRDLDSAVRDPFADGAVWPGDVQPLLGIRVSRQPAGLRGVTVRWVDGAGVAGERTFDFAVLTCAPDPCDNDDALLRALGLLR